MKKCQLHLNATFECLISNVTYRKVNTEIATDKISLGGMRYKSYFYQMLLWYIQELLDCFQIVDLLLHFSR